MSDSSLEPIRHFEPPTVTYPHSWDDETRLDMLKDDTEADARAKALNLLDSCVLADNRHTLTLL